MRVEAPFNVLYEAMASATHNDLPDISYWQRDWKAFRALPKEEAAKLKSDEGPGELKLRRPHADEVHVVMFPQTWGSTACGYGGLGGAAWTEAYTIIVSDSTVSCVYFGCGRLAYSVDRRVQSEKGRARFLEDMRAQSMAHCNDKSVYD